MYIAGDNIISPLGFTSAENYGAAKADISGLRYYETGTFGLPEPFMASLIDRTRLRDEFAGIASGNNYTDLEKAAILSVFRANGDANADLSNEKTIFILSTTKGNIDVLEADNTSRVLSPQIYLWHTAEIIADFFKNPNTPVAVSNACISGAAAQIVAMRELETGNYDHAVVVGVDFLSKFIISGFQSFKALAVDRCRPFDRERCGLNLGEAAATIIFSSHKNGAIQLINGAIRNDANHISAPSRTGEGSFRALKYVLQGIDVHNIAFVNAHGTATPYNDAMEACAISRAGMNHVPVQSLKPYFGHTLGTAGVLESIISMHALLDHTVLKSSGIIYPDFGNQINIALENQTSSKRCFVKLLSGFGGCNAALLFCCEQRNG